MEEYVRNMCQDKGNKGFLLMKEDRGDIKTGRNDTHGRRWHGSHRLVYWQKSFLLWWHSELRASCKRNLAELPQKEAWVRGEGLVSCWLLEGCMRRIVNQDKGIHSPCKIQSGTKMKQRQTWQTWKMFVFIIYLTFSASFCYLLS